MSTAAYEMVIGLEVHAELKTKTKIFCGCSTAFGGEPNTQCCPVCMGMPGTLPVLNRQAVYFAVKAGLATNCQIAPYSKEDRKNYFYPDLPKAYQISQYDLPLCHDGWLEITADGKNKRVGITRIHIEEDAGKLLHTDDGSTLCDYNRCGVPLIEIVSEPDIRSGAEAAAYLRKLRSILLYTGVSDCRMQEGSLRCDVNLSVRKPGEQALGTRTEMKNLNSFQFIQKAIEYECKRQVETLEAGESIVQETRRFEQASGMTIPMRRKENANDYRYFPDPDLIPIVLDDATMKRLYAEIPELPDERKAAYAKRYGLSDHDAELLVSGQSISDYFEAAVQSCSAPKQLANLLISEVLRLMEDIESPIPVSPVHLARLAELLAENRLNSSSGKKLLQQIWETDEDPEALAEAEKLWQISDEALLRPIAEQIVRENEKSAADYRAGKTKALQTLIGHGMKLTNGQCDPLVLRRLLEAMLQ